MSNDIIENNRNYPEWYCVGNSHNYVTKVTLEDKSIHIYCDGIMRIHYNDIDIRTSDDFALAKVYTDDDIEDIDHLGGQWINNPWFDCYADWGDMDHLDIITHDINDAIKEASDYLFRLAIEEK